MDNQELHEYLSAKKDIQESLLLFIENEDNDEENYQNLIQTINDQQIQKDANELRLFLHLIDCISKYHYRTNNFFEKIEKILLTFKEEIQKMQSDYNIFKIFEKNKRIMLFLIENDLLKIDQDIAQLINGVNELKFPNYFFNEIKPFLNDDQIKQIEKTNDLNTMDMIKFEERRLIGENEKNICNTMRKDLISDFIIYAEKDNLSLNTTIKLSIFETNYFPNFKEPTLIEYAAFYGSIQIFRFLYKNDATVTPLIWQYAIHGNNPELIHFLEENKITPENEKYEACLETAIMCHHNETVEYLKNNYFKDNPEIDQFINTKSLISYNFEFIQTNSFDQNNYTDWCKNDYYFFIQQTIKNKRIDANVISKSSNKKENKSSLARAWQEAIIFDNLNIAKLILNSDEIDINEKIYFCSWQKYKCEWNVFYYLILQRNSTAIQFLLEKKDIDVNNRMIEKYYKENNSIEVIEYSPIHRSIILNNLYITKLFLSHPKIDVNSEFIKTFSGDIWKVSCLNPICLSIQYNNEEILKLLLDHPKIDINKILIDRSNNTEVFLNPLYNAVSNKSLSIVKILLSHEDIDVNLQYKIIQNGYLFQNNVIHKAMAYNEIEIFKLLLSHPKIDINALEIEHNYKKIFHSEMSALAIAVDKGLENIVQLLLSHNDVDVNFRSFLENEKSKSYTPILHNAIIKGNYNIVQYLLSYPKIDVNQRSFNKTTNKEIIEIFEETAINQAIMRENIEILKLLLAHPQIDLNKKSKKTLFTPKDFFIEERTPIKIAVFQNKTKSFQFIANYLKNNNELTKELLNELINIATDSHMKSLIYSFY